MFRLQRESTGPDVISVPGGKLVARLLACVGFTTGSLTIALSFVPSPDEANPMLAATKVVAATLVLVAVGGILYWLGKRRTKEV